MGKKSFRLIISTMLILSLLFANTAMIFAADDTDGAAYTEDSKENGSGCSVINNDQGTNIVLIRGQSYNLETASFNVSSGDCFTIDSAGKLKANNVDGSGTVKVTLGDLSTLINIEVVDKKPAVIDQENKKITIGKRKSVSLPSLIKNEIADMKDADGNEINEKALIKRNAQINKDKLTVKHACTFKVKYTGLIEQTYNVKAEDPQFAQKSYTMKPGETLELGFGPTTLPVTWISAAPELIGVSDGVVTAYSEGSANICATVNGVQFVTKVTAKADKGKPSATKVYLNKTGNYNKKNVKIIGAKSKDYTWTSENEDIAIVKSGNISAKGTGRTEVTATNINGGDSIVIPVYVFDVHNSDSSGADVYIPVGETSEITLDFGFNDSDWYPDIVWNTSDKSIATVNNGVVHAIKKGNVTISANVFGKKIKTKVKVKEAYDKWNNTGHQHKWKYDSENGDKKYCELCEQWEYCTFHTVSFESNGGSQVESIRVREDKVPADYNIPAPEKSEYEFRGWFTDKDLTVPFDSSQPLADDIVLYAKWYKPSTPVTPVAPDPTVVVDGPGSTDDN